MICFDAGNTRFNYRVVGVGVGGVGLETVAISA